MDDDEEEEKMVDSFDEDYEDPEDLLEVNTN
jgi:hypothetical protein